MTLERGQVIALRRNGAGIILVVDSPHVTIVPVGGYNGPPPHRAEIRLDDPTEIFACGVSYRFPVVRCHMTFPMHAATANAALVLGNAPGPLMTRIINALRREMECRALEARLHFCDISRGLLPVQL
jgi:hypothetical protein